MPRKIRNKSTPQVALQKIGIDDEKYFAKLRYKRIQKQVFGRHVRSGQAVAVDFFKDKISNHNQEINYVIYRRLGSRVKGLVLKVTDEELRKADEYEATSPGLYTRKRIKLANGDKAWAYVAKIKTGRDWKF